MFKLTEIKDEIKSKPLSWVYKITSPNDYKLVFKTNGKNESKNKIKEKYGNKKLDHSIYFIVCKITFHSGTKFAQGGPVAANFDVYAFIDGKLTNILNDSSNKYKHVENIKGVVWFDKLFLEKRGWDYKYVDNIIEKLIKGNFVLMQKTVYHVKFT
jgi:hypothetical protein